MGVQYDPAEFSRESIVDLNRSSFTKDSAGNTARRIKGELSIDGGSILNGVSYDYISVAYPTTTREVYTYYLGGSGGTLQATITVDYTDTTKDFVSAVERT